VNPTLNQQLVEVVLSSVNLARSVTLSVLLLVATISLAQGVKIVSPGAGAVSSPVRVVADFSSTAPLDSISVFVDNVEMRQLMPVTPLDLSVSMSEGSHLLTVKAVQADGTEISSSRSVNVSPPQTVSSIRRSSGSVTYNNIEQMSGWYTYPDQGSPVCSSKPKVVSAPSVDGASGQFYLGPRGQYNNCLWPILLGSSSKVTHFRLDADYRLSNPSYAQGVEFSSNKHVGTNWYKFSVQCSYNKGVFSVWDTAGARWSPTNIPCKRPALKSWDHLTVNTEISNGKAVFLSLTLNGVRHTINRSFLPVRRSSSENFGVHFQMDGNKAGNEYDAYLDELTFTAW